MSTLSLHNISFTYLAARQPALRDISLAIGQGQICGVVGTIGAGKSTLAALCAGFMPQFFQGRISGSALLDGRDLLASSVAELVRHVALVRPDPYSQISGARFSVAEEVAFGLENLGVPAPEIYQRVEQALDAMELCHLRDRSPYALSGGQQQRLVIAAALALRPAVLVLDEPTAQIDPLGQHRLADLLRALARSGTAILVAEHRLEWLAELADHVLALDEGQPIAYGPPAEVLASPLLVERGIGWPRPTALVAHMRAQGALPAHTPLPITEQGAIEALHGLALPPRLPAPPPAPAAPIVALDMVRYRYPTGVEALRGVSLRIAPGERMALLGPNGAGKSTLVRHLNGIIHPSAGQVQIGGQEARRRSVAQLARTVGVVFQDTRNQLFAHTVRDEVAFGPKNLRHSPARVAQLVDAALDALGLRAVAAEHPYDLPPAMRRLVAIASVLAMEPPLLVLDEPTAGLDGPSTQRIRALCEQRMRAGQSTLVVSHDLDFSYEALDRVILLDQGQIVFDLRWEAFDEQHIRTLRTIAGLPLALRLDQPTAHREAGA
ncbi:ABC transporter ATP-binding protein [Chloroflexia bacterium SDU3-3]|nr:ABC transporter ATP-binding protein [Chloroflexia bacterium SDU3-3]